MRAKALLYRLGEDTQTGRRLREVLQERSILALSVDERHLGERVERLVATNAAPADAPPPDDAPRPEFLLLCNLGERQLDRLLGDLRRAGVFVPCKAVLTGQNRKWTLCQLIEEVAREHEALRGGSGE